MPLGLPLGKIALAIASLGALATAAAVAQVPEPLVASRGAAPGYLDDQVCATCHAELAASYREVAMSQAFVAPERARPIEDFAAPPFVHGASGQTFELQRGAGGALTFRSWVAGAEGRRDDVLEAEVAWVLGSGNHARTYLAQAPNGELFQLPLAFYGQQGRWGMAPGYDRPDHAGPTRLVRRECLFCHGAYPEVAEGADRRLAPTHAVPTTLPTGIGCQRCHGPGEGHVRLAAGGIGSLQEIRGAIVNPARLAPDLRRDVCYQCHYQPSVAIAGLRRLGRPDFSFRPGQRLDDYLVKVDVEQEGVAPGDRFEINHHPYRLERSRCFSASPAGSLQCTTCHDPHRKVAPADRAAHYRQACVGCHTAPTPCPGNAGRPAATLDCASCHMPSRRPSDVVQVLMTDHQIQRRLPPGLTAPRAESDPILEDIHLPGASPDDAELYRALTAVRTRADTPGALDALGRALHRLKPQILDPYLDLLDGLLDTRRLADAQPLLAAAAARWPSEPALAERQALFAAAAGDRAGALARLESLRAQGWRRPELAYNLGLLRRGLGDLEGARAALAEALADRPFFPPAWQLLGEVEQARGDHAAALRAFGHARALIPPPLRAGRHPSHLSKKLEISPRLR